MEDKINLSVYKQVPHSAKNYKNLSTDSSNYTSKYQDKIDSNGNFTEASHLIYQNNKPKVSLSRIPRNSIRYLKEIHTKIVENSSKRKKSSKLSEDNFPEKNCQEYKQTNYRDKIEGSPKVGFYIKSRGFSQIIDEKPCKFSDIAWNFTRRNGQKDFKKQDLEIISKKKLVRIVPARFLPICQVKKYRIVVRKHVPHRTVKNDLRLITENTQEITFKRVLVDKTNRSQMEMTEKYSFLRDSNEESWGWRTPKYTEN
ncbi:hypothetical protein SteCoe_30833 [Stentor coeruleus]|uniref:Uncharacterized protein n=1 Tax=Stentor coeruleus TaxID=5963 RepID=A0A1R2B2P1_9CILI|nr:hypothetical protein SteCoe_30833 [Stentor coeruleus]